MQRYNLRQAKGKKIMSRSTKNLGLVKDGNRSRDDSSGVYNIVLFIVPFHTRICGYLYSGRFPIN